MTSTLSRVLAVALALLPTAALAQTPSDPAAVSVFEKIGDELVGSGLGGGGLIDEWKSKLIGGGAIAIWPLGDNDVPLPKPVLEAWNDTLTSTLLRSAKGRYRFVTRADLNAVIREASHAEVVEDGNPVAAVLKGSKADFVVTGRARMVDNGVAVSYRLLEAKTGSPRSATREYVVPLDFGRLSAQQGSLALDAAVAEAAGHFAKTIPDLSVVRRRGIRHGDSGEETALGRYLSDRVVDALVEKASNALTERRVKVVDAGLDAATVKTMQKSRSAGPAVVNAALVGSEPGSYVLEGAYWVVDQFVELRMAAISAGGERYTWNRRIFKGTVRPDLLGASASKPPANGWGKSGGIGPITLELTSNKGQNPSYRIGDNVVFLVRLGEEAVVNCFYRQVDGQTMKIFPNRYQPSGKIAGKALMGIPGEAMPFAFQASAPEGVERVKCFAIDRDVSAQLPKEIGAQDLTPLSAATAERLSEIYRAVPNAKISEATMVVTVHK
ncbi:MAG: DUF4384 domain-containing protein [Magnetospirillum sp.]|nr:DUF4384 domain-containing protein [Magnetospirillum sp.]